MNAPNNGGHPEALGMSMDQIHNVQRAQAEHARSQELERFARQFPIVREVIDELAAAKARIVELEAKLSESATNDGAATDAGPEDVEGEAPKASKRGKRKKPETDEPSSPVAEEVPAHLTD
jgi:hypothetical protein